MYRGKFEAGQRGNPPAPAPSRKKKMTTGTVIFYSLYFAMIAAACVAIWLGLGWAENWLIDFEASQPDAKCQEVFDQYFADPDWSQVYTLLDSEAVGPMTKEEFASYMESTVGDRPLTYSKTSAGLSGGRKYILRLNGENLGTFTLMNSVSGDLEIPDWQLSAVEIFVSAKEYVSITTDQGNTVLVNGIALEDSHIIKTTSTLAEDFLPEGVHGPRTATYYMDGLLNPPKVEVTDHQGNPVAMAYDAQAKHYTQESSAQSQTVPQDLYDFILEGTKSYCRYMLDVGSAAQLQNYFDRSSDTYNTIIRNKDRWLQNFRTYDFGKETIDDYCVYSEALVSVRVSVDLNVTRSNGTVKTIALDTTFFAQRNGRGWQISEMTNVEVAQERTQVRMRYFQDGKLLSSEMVATDSDTLKTPAVVPPEGKRFTGWFRESKDDKGNTTYSLVFQPGEDGAVKLPADYVLEPMTLHALFEEDK